MAKRLPLRVVHQYAYTNSTHALIVRHTHDSHINTICLTVRSLSVLGQFLGKRDLILIILGGGISPLTKFFLFLFFFVVFYFFYSTRMRDDLCTDESDDG